MAGFWVGWGNESLRMAGHDVRGTGTLREGVGAWARRKVAGASAMPGKLAKGFQVAAGLAVAAPVAYALLSSGRKSSTPAPRHDADDDFPPLMTSQSFVPAQGGDGASKDDMYAKMGQHAQTEMTRRGQVPADGGLSPVRN